MADSKTFAFNVEAARKDGHTDAQIADYLGRQSGFDVEAARRDGHSDTDIVAHLAAAPVAEGGFITKNQTPAQVAAEKDAVNRVSAAPGAERMFGQGVTAGWGDELDAGLAAAQTGGNNFIRKMTDRPDVGYGMSDAYHAVRAAEGNLDAQYRQQHPYAAAGAELAGSVVSPMAKGGAGFVSRGASAGGRMTRAAVAGAGFGAVAGAGAADGGFVDRAKGAGVGAMTGAATGALLSGGLDAVQTGLRGANAATGYRFASPEGAAGARLRQALEADGVTPEKVAAAVAEYGRVGAESPVLADVAGENTRALLRFAGSRPGTTARNTMQTYRDETAHGLPDASINRARQLTPDEPRPAGAVAEDIATARDAAARTDYAPAYATRVQIDPQTASALQGDAGRAAIQRARTAAAARRDDLQVQELDSLLAAKDPNTLPEVSAGTLDRVRIAMGERATTAGRRNANDIASGLRGRAEDINASLDNVPEMAPARANYRSHSQAIEGVQDIGPTVLKAPPDEFSASVSALDERGRAAAQVGARQAITDILGQRASAMGTLDQIAWAPNTRQNLTALFGPDEADRFIQSARLNLERGRNANYMAPNTGPQTFNRGEDAKSIGSMLNIVRKPVETILEKVANGLTVTEAEAEQLVRLGLMDPQAAMAATKPSMVRRVGSFAGSRVTGGAPMPAAGEMTRRMAPPPPARP